MNCQNKPVLATWICTQNMHAFRSHNSFGHFKGHQVPESLLAETKVCMKARENVLRKLVYAQNYPEHVLTTEKTT